MSWKKIVYIKDMQIHDLQMDLHIKLDMNNPCLGNGLFISRICKSMSWKWIVHIKDMQIHDLEMDLHIKLVYLASYF